VDGTDGIGVFKPRPGDGKGLFVLRNGFSGPEDHTFVFGKGDQSPLVGDWDGN